MRLTKRPRPVLTGQRGLLQLRYILPAVATVLFCLLQFSVTGTWTRIVPLQMHTLSVLVVNIPLMTCGVLLLLAIVNRFWTASFIATCVSAVIFIANRIRIGLLGSPIEPAADIRRIRDTLPYLGGLLASRRTILWLFALLVLGLLAMYLDRRLPLGGREPRQRLCAGVLALLVLAAVPAVAPYLPLMHLYGKARNDWTASCAGDGVPLVYMANLHEIVRRKPTPPPGYSRERILAISNRMLEEYHPAAAAGRLPDVVVIAAEAMMDPSELPNISHPVDWLASLHSLQRETGPYRLVSPSMGGVSINADFEVLTGFSTYFIGNEDASAADILERAVPNLARVLKSHGYETVAIVPTPRTLFRHEWVFKNALGFDRSMFEEEMGGHMGDIPDAETASRILKELNTPTSLPRFIYAQFERNHLPWGKKNYSYPTVVPRSSLTGPEASSFNSYIQGIYETDRVIGALANALRERERPLVLAVYGDHLPALGNAALVAIGVTAGKSLDAPASALALHRTPGLVWTTGGLAAVPADGLIGLNYLTAYVLKGAGISHPFYTDFLSRLHGVLPAFNHHVICQPDGEPVSSIPRAAQAMVDDYALLEYDMIFGKQYASNRLFAPAPTVETLVMAPRAPSRRPWKH